MGSERLPLATMAKLHVHVIDPREPGSRSTAEQGPGAASGEQRARPRPPATRQPQLDDCVECTLEARKRRAKAATGRR